MSAVVVTRRGSASWARIDRPAAANACGSAVMDGLEEWLATAPTQPDVRVLVLTGTGSAFCAGADVREGAALVDDPDALVAYVGRGRALVEALAAAPLPTIAAVNGAAFAGGLELVLACDLAVAAQGARLGDRHVRHGIVPGWGSSARLPRRIGRAAATRLLLTGEDVDAGEALRLGLVSEVVAADALVGAVDALADRLAGLPAPALARVLRLTRADVARPLGDALAEERSVVEEHLRDPAVRAALRGVDLG